MDNLGELMGGLFPDDSTNPQSFQPVAFYHPEMDYLMYVNEDCSFRADRLSRFVTVLWHPHEEGKLVGVKLKGFRKMFLQAKGGGALSEDEFRQFIRWLAIALYCSAGEAIDDRERARLKELSEKARQVVSGVRISDEELAKAA